MTKLEITGLSLTRGARTLIADFSYRFDGGCIYALLGNNGSGKTTFLKTLAGLLELELNRVFIDGHDLGQMQERDRARVISFLLQHSPDQPYCTGLSRISHGLMPIYGFNYSPDNESRALIEHVAKRLNIEHLLDRRLRDMSGGEQRLIHLAKCLLNPNIRILLLDEPSVFLDFSQQDRLGHFLKDFAQGGKVIIFSSHDVGFIQRFSHKVIRISEQQAHVADQPSSSFNFLARSDNTADFTFSFS